MAHAEHTRRSVLRLLGGGLLTTTLAGSVVTRSARSARATQPTLLGNGLADVPLHPLHRSRFAAAVGATFAARAAHGTFYLRLHEIRDLPTSSAADADHSFNLLFHPVGRKLAEGIYDVESHESGRATLFLSPVGQTGRTMQGLVNQTS